jgi:ATP-dependent DNA helicase
VIVYRLATKGTVEEALLTSADAKRRLEKLVIRKGGFRDMARKSDDHGALDSAELRALLLKDGLAYEWADGGDVLSDRDIEALCDRLARDPLCLFFILRALCIYR